VLLSGRHYDSAIIPIIPKKKNDLAAIAAFCFDPLFREAIRQVDQKVAVTTATVLKVPFDIEHWREMAAQRYPKGLPEPESDDPTQWLFHGRPEASVAPLQVATGRLLGYRWPVELDTEVRLSAHARELVRRCDELLKLAAADGIVCIPAVRTESPADERVLEMLKAAYGQKWSNSLLHDLLSNAGCKPGSTLDDWLRNVFF